MKQKNDWRDSLFPVSTISDSFFTHLLYTITQKSVVLRDDFRRKKFLRYLYIIKCFHINLLHLQKISFILSFNDGDFIYCHVARKLLTFQYPSSILIVTEPATPLVLLCATRRDFYFERGTYDESLSQKNTDNPTTTPILYRCWYDNILCR